MKNRINGGRIILPSSGPAPAHPFHGMGLRERIEWLRQQSAALGKRTGALLAALADLTDIPNWVAALVVVVARRLDVDAGELLAEVEAELEAQRAGAAGDLVEVQKAGGRDYSTVRSMGAKMLLGSAFKPAAPEEAKEDGDGG